MPERRSLKFFKTAAEVSDHIGAAALLRGMPSAEWFVANRGYDADWYRKSLRNNRIRICIPGRKSRKTKIRFDRRCYKRRNRIEIMVDRLKDWRRVASRYDRCPIIFLSALFWR